MFVKWSQFINRFLQSLLALTITFLLLSIILIPLYELVSVPLLDVGAIDPFLVFAGVALLLCLCIFIPIKAIKILSKIAIALGSFFTLPLYLPIGFDLVTIVKYVIHFIVWLVAISTACKEGARTTQGRVSEYVSNRNFFKKFSIFIATLFIIGNIVLFFVDYTLIIRYVIDLLWIITLYIIIELLLIRASRDAIYCEIKTLDKAGVTASTIVFGAGCVTSVSLFFLFKKVLDKLLVSWIKAAHRFFLFLIKLYKNFINYIERLLQAIALRKARDDLFFDPSVSKEDILKDFGLGNLPIGGGNGGNGGGFGGSGGGGIGSISGINGNLSDIFGDLSGLGGLGGYGLAGLIGGSLSESGALGVGDHAEAIKGNAAAMAFVRTETGSPVYLKLKSFGDYNGKGWNEATKYSYLIDDAYSMNYLSGAAIANQGEKAAGIEIISLTGQYFLPDYLAMGEYNYAIQTSDVYAHGNASEVYSLKYYDYSEVMIERSVPIQYSMAEQQYASFVREQYLDLPNDTYEQISAFLDQNGIYLDSTHTQIAHSVFKLLSNYTYNLEYDKALDKEKDVVLSFLTDYKEGICQHFASASVVMFRALGIPARYVGGLYVQDTNAGEWTVVVANAAHAWVEIYQFGVGWIRIDPTQYAQYKGPSLENSFTQDEYESLIGNNPGGPWGDDSFDDSGWIDSSISWEEGSSDSWGDDSSDGDNSSGGPWGDDSSDDSSWGDDSSLGGESSNSSGPWGDNDSSGGGNSSGDNDNSSGGGASDKDDSTSDGNSSGDNDNSSGGASDKNDSSDKDDDSESDEENLQSSQESSSSTSPSCDNFPWLPVGISAAVIGATLVTVLLIRLLKKRKKSVRKIKVNKKNLSPEETLIVEEEISRAAAQIIRDNYKDFIKIAGKNGIRKYPIDTTQSLRNKYNKQIGENEAMEILTQLYRIARYNKNEKLTAEDAEQSNYCLDILQKEFAKKKKEKSSK